MLSQPKQNLVCLAWDFHSKTGINTHLIKIYHKPASVLNWDPTQTHRGRNKRKTERRRSKRDKQREAGVRFGYPDLTPQQHLGWCSTAITESSMVCVWERQRDRDRQKQRREKSGWEGERKRGIRKNKIYYLNNNFENCCSKLKTARCVLKIQHLNPLKWSQIKNSLQNIVTKQFFFWTPQFSILKY